MGELLLAPRINKALVNQQLEIGIADAVLAEKAAEITELELKARAWCRCAVLFCCSKCEETVGIETVGWAAPELGLL
jgi:hypothetical protein